MSRSMALWPLGSTTSSKVTRVSTRWAMRIEAVARRLARRRPDLRRPFGRRRRLHALENVVEGRPSEMELASGAIERGKHDLILGRVGRHEALPVLA